MRADLEDDPHRYGVILRHDGQTITGIEGRAIRTPWTACIEATNQLDRLVGLPLMASALEIYRATDGRQQCTHMCDLAGLAAAHAARGSACRQYDMAVPDADPDGTRTVSLSRDGEALLTWQMKGDAITGPPPFDGHDIRDVQNWSKEFFGADLDGVEAVFVLRRAVRVSGSRLSDLDARSHAGEIARMIGACYVYQHGVAERARRVYGSTFDFTDAPDALLADRRSAESTAQGGDS